MKFSPKCRTKKLGMIYTIFGSFCSIRVGGGADIRPEIRLRKIPEMSYLNVLQMKIQFTSYSLAEQAGLSLTLSQTTKSGFPASRLILFLLSQKVGYLVSLHSPLY